MASFPQPEDDSVPTTGSTRPFDDDGWLRPQTLLPVIRLLRRLRVAQGLRHGFPNLPYISVAEKLSGSCGFDFATPLFMSIRSLGITAEQATTILATQIKHASTLCPSSSGARYPALYVALVLVLLSSL
ncbi:unnamed protein product [Malus baccata var. baccata]